MRLLIDWAHRVRRTAMALVGWRTRGVKVMVFDANGALLLVRQRYGNSALWMLPGGGIGRGEPPVNAAIREVMEETGCAIAEVVALGAFEARIEGRRDTVHLFRATTSDAPVADGVELAEACFFGLDTLPDTTSPATMRRIAELIGQRAVTSEW